MATNDLKDVSNIERDVFPNPWSPQSFANELLHSFSEAFVVCKGENLIGYAVIWHLEMEMHIANIAIAPFSQRKGIGTWLLTKLIKRAQKNGQERAFLEVRKTNHTAIKLYKKFGFEIIDVRKNYYQQENEDAFIMSCNLCPQKKVAVLE